MNREQPSPYTQEKLDQLERRLQEASAVLAGPNPPPGTRGYVQRLLRSRRWYQAQGFLPKDEPLPLIVGLGISYEPKRRGVMQVSPDVVLNLDEILQPS